MTRSATCRAQNHAKNQQNPVPRSAFVLSSMSAPVFRRLGGQRRAAMAIGAYKGIQKARHTTRLALLLQAEQAVVDHLQKAAAVVAMLAALQEAEKPRCRETSTVLGSSFERRARAWYQGCFSLPGIAAAGEGRGGQVSRWES